MLALQSKYREVK